MSVRYRQAFCDTLCRRFARRSLNSGQQNETFTALVMAVGTRASNAIVEMENMNTSSEGTKCNSGRMTIRPATMEATVTRSTSAYVQRHCRSTASSTVVGHVIGSAGRDVPAAKLSGGDEPTMATTCDRVKTTYGYRRPSRLVRVRAKLAIWRARHTTVSSQLRRGGLISGWSPANRELTGVPTAAESEVELAHRRQSTVSNNSEAWLSASPQALGAIIREEWV